MDQRLKLGDRFILKRPTFLYKGIFVLQGSTVEIKEIGPKITVEWYDREGNPHLIDNIQPKELEQEKDSF